MSGPAEHMGSAKRTERRLTYTVEEAAALIGISRAKAYKCVRSGELRSVHLGRRIVIPAVAIEDLLGMEAALLDHLPIHESTRERLTTGATSLGATPG